MRRLATILILLLGLFSPQMLLAADFTQRLNFQGKLSDTGAAANGTYNIKFELCSASDCSTVIWTEYHDAANAGQVTVTNGIFNTILGTDEALTSVDFDQALWIRITVDGTGGSPSYATPLGIIPLGSTPAAQEAKSLSGLESTDFMQVIGATGTQVDFGLGVIPYLSTAGGNFVTRVGYLAGYTQTGYSNTFVGYLSGLSATGWQNTTLGDRAGGGITGGQSNTALGYFAGRNLASGTANTLVGSRAGVSLTGDSNIFIGSDAGYSQTTGTASVLIGVAAGYASTAASTTAVGYYAGYNNTGAANTFLGYNSGYANTSGYSNTFLGYEAGDANTTGNSNTFLGAGAGGANATGTTNTFVGRGAGGNVTDSGNIAIGSDALALLTTGQNNIALGNAAMYFANNVSSTIAIGTGVGASMTGSGNILLGNQAGTLSGASNSIFIGASAGQGSAGSSKLYIENTSSATPLLYGEFDNDLVTVNGDLYVGGSSYTGSNGASELRFYEDSNYISFQAPLISSDYSYTWPSGAGSDGNVLATNGSGTLSWIAISEITGNEVSGSSDRVVFTNNSGQLADSAAIKFDDDTDLFTTVFGYFSSGTYIGANNTNNLIDDASNGASSATLYIGNETIDTSVSDRRLKTNISSPETSALSYLAQFNVVAFDWLEGNERREDGRVPFGLIAQDVADIAPQYTKQGDNPEDYMSVRFQDMVPLTIKAIQEIDARVAALESDGVRGAVNSVTNLVELVVDRLRVRSELCIGDTCVDEATLKALLAEEETDEESVTPTSSPSAEDSLEEESILAEEEGADGGEDGEGEEALEDVATSTPDQLESDSEEVEDDSESEEVDETEVLPEEEVESEIEEEATPTPEPETTASSTPAVE